MYAPVGAIRPFKGDIVNRVRVLLIACTAMLFASFAFAGVGNARSRASVSVAVPRAVLAGARVRIAGIATGSVSGVELRQRRGRRWVPIAVSGTGRSGRFVIAWAVPARAGRAVVQVASVRRRAVIARTPPMTVRIALGGHGGRRTVVGRPGKVTALPAPGTSGDVRLQGAAGVAPGQVLALGYSPSTPNGFLGRVLAVSSDANETVLQTQPASLEQAGATGTLDLATFHQVGGGSAADRKLGAQARPASAGIFNHGIGTAVKCSDGASASLTGSVSVALTPALHASFSLFGGLNSADFSLTGNASASLVANADASAGCALTSTPLFAAPVHIATFTGAIGPIPVVVVLQGQIYVDGDLSGSAAATSSITASAQITGGIRYQRGHGFSPVFNGPSTSFNFSPPTVTGKASAQVNVEPALQMLLYGVGGPQLGVKGGLAFNADTSANPWWTLKAPLSVEASLTAPDLDLESGTLTLYHHTFDVANAGGPFTSGPTVPPTSPPDGSGQRTFQIDWNTDQTDIDLHVWDPTGAEAWYVDKAGMANGTLSDDVTTGFGPEIFTTTDATTPLAIGVCYFADHSGDVPPTDVTVTITEADGSTRVDHVTLNQPGDEALVDTSPSNAATFTPASGWCSSDNGGTSP
jgi:hypothetical protein